MIDTNGSLVAIFRYDNLVANPPTLQLVTASPFNLSMEGGANVGLVTDDSGDLHLSMTVDPNNPYILYAGGDTQAQVPNQAGNSTLDGRIFRFDTTVVPASFTPVTGAYAPGAGPGPGWTAAPGPNIGGIFPPGTTFQYAISYVDPAGEESALSAPFTVALTGNFNFTYIGLSNLTAGAPQGTRDIKIYRTKNGGTQFYFLASLSMTTAALTYQDKTPDGSLGSPVAPYTGLTSVLSPFPGPAPAAFPVPNFDPPVSSTSTNPKGTGLVRQATYYYEFVSVNAMGQQSAPSPVLSYVAGKDGFTFDLSGNAPDPGTYYLVYRTSANDTTTYRLVGVVGSGTTSFTDTTPDFPSRGRLATYDRHGPARRLPLDDLHRQHAGRDGRRRHLRAHQPDQRDDRLLAVAQWQPRGSRVLPRRTYKPARKRRDRRQPG